jgi:Fe2+ or Zn2+ uptake regulation protein
VACVDIEQCVGDQVKRIEEHSNFKVKEHSLKLFGVCQRCQG